MNQPLTSEMSYKIHQLPEQENSFLFSLYQELFIFYIEFIGSLLKGGNELEIVKAKILIVNQIVDLILKKIFLI
jgi:hypothetical protein